MNKVHFEDYVWLVFFTVVDGRGKTSTTLPFSPDFQMEVNRSYQVSAVNLMPTFLKTKFHKGGTGERIINPKSS